MNNHFFLEEKNLTKAYKTFIQQKLAYVFAKLTKHVNQY